VPVFLVRHGSAGSRDEDDPYDLCRSLDAKGRAQALVLADVLSTHPVHRVLSSEAPRCQQTVGPLADRLGLTVEVDSALTEGADIEDAWALVERCSGTPATVLCSHGDVIPMVLRRAQLRGMVIPGKAGCAKGSIWMVTFKEGLPVLGEYATP
jgi:broad specificity phosphatase PhoE